MREHEHAWIQDLSNSRNRGIYPSVGVLFFFVMSALSALGAVEWLKSEERKKKVLSCVREHKTTLTRR